MIVGPIHFVGTRGLAVFLVATPAGHILLNGAMPGTAPLIEASIRKLGFRPEDIRIMLSGHAHVDHVGTHAALQKLSGAQVAVMDRDVELIESGGRTDFHYGHLPRFRFDPVKVDRVLRDGDTVTLGGVTMTAHLTPGHTQGCTTWTMDVVDGGRSYSVAFPDGTSVNSGYRLERQPSYPGIADDFRRTFRVLEALHPDVWLPAHTSFADFPVRRTRAAQDGPAAWIDPEGYRTFVADRRANFERLLATERTAAGPDGIGSPLVRPPAGE